MGINIDLITTLCFIGKESRYYERFKVGMMDYDIALPTRPGACQLL